MLMAAPVLGSVPRRYTAMSTVAARKEKKKPTKYAMAEKAKGRASSIVALWRRDGLLPAAMMRLSACTSPVPQDCLPEANAGCR